MFYSPFAILQGLGVWFLGNSFIFVLKNSILNKFIKFFPIIFILLSFFFISYRTFISNSESIYYVIRFLMPYFFMGTIWLLKDYFSRIDVLKKIGDLSFPIYIIHPLLCNVLYLICQKYLCVNIVTACVVQVIVFLISYLISYFINNILILQKIFFPRSMDDLKSIIKITKR